MKIFEDIVMKRFLYAIGMIWIAIGCRTILYADETKVDTEKKQL